MKLNIYALCVVVLFASSCSKPFASFTSDVQDGHAPVNVKFTNTSKKAETYVWNFGDGTTSEDPQPEHKYLLSGRYKISLTAKKGTKSNTMEKELVFEAPHDCLLEMETSMGNIMIKLHDATPQHRDNFIKLAETGYLDGLLFHRVISGFMIQGGDPDSKTAKKGQRLGMGGPGYTVPAEFVESLVHIKGALAAARTGDAMNPEKRSSGSQFYIVQGRPVNEQQLNVFESQKGIKYSAADKEILMTLGGTPMLDKEYTVFGQVVKGIEILDAIAAAKTDGSDRPVEDVKIIKIRVIK